MSTQEELYNLTTKSNYRPSFLEDMDVLLISYITIIHHYIVYFFENKETIKPVIMNKGINMLSHIFVILLHYSKNLGLTIHHSKTSIVYYVEYINQITDKDDNMFFNLSLKDAIIYVYTKTIYVVPEEIRKSHILTTLEKQQLENLQETILKYTHFIENIVTLECFQNATIKQKEDFLKNLLEIIKTGIIDFHNSAMFIDDVIGDKIQLCNNDLIQQKDISIETITENITQIFNENVTK